MSISGVPICLDDADERILGGSTLKREDIAAGLVIRPNFIYPLKDHHNLLYNRKSGLVCYFSKDDSEKQTETSAEKYYIRCFATTELQSILDQLKKRGVEYLQSNRASDFRKIYTRYYAGTPEWRPGVAGSCMRYDPEDFGDDIGDTHPCEIYATNPNVEIAGLRLNLKTIARCILHTGKMERTKTYAGGDTCDDCRMVEFLFNLLLEKKGFALNRMCLNKEKFDIVESPSGGIIFPYIDDVLNVRIKDPFVVVDLDGDINCSADGTIENEEVIGVCRYCGDRIIDGDDDYVSMPDTDDIYCCWDCATHGGWTTCERCGSVVHENDGSIVMSEFATFCSSHCANKSDVFICDDCCSYHHIDDMTSSDDGIYCENCVEKCNSCDSLVRTTTDGLCERCQKIEKEKEEEDESEVKEKQEVSTSASEQQHATILPK